MKYLPSPGVLVQEAPHHVAASQIPGIRNRRGIGKFSQCLEVEHQSGGAPVHGRTERGFQSLGIALHQGPEDLDSAENPL